MTCEATGSETKSCSVQVSYIEVCGPKLLFTGPRRRRHGKSQYDVDWSNVSTAPDMYDIAPGTKREVVCSRTYLVVVVMVVALMATAVMVIVVVVQPLLFIGGLGCAGSVAVPTVGHHHLRCSLCARRFSSTFPVAFIAPLDMCCTCCSFYLPLALLPLHSRSRRKGRLFF